MPKVLVVEDDPAIAENLLYALRTEGFEAEHVLTGTDGIEDIHSEAYDLVVLDIGLPDQSGLDVCQKIRIASQVPILFLTARDSEVDRILGLEMGGDDYVTKPFSPREVVARVRAILRRSAPVTAERNVSDALFHDSEAMRILCRGEALELTAHEYRLLLILLSHPGRVYSRAQLMDAAWDDPGAAMERTVEVDQPLPLPKGVGANAVGGGGQAYISAPSSGGSVPEPSQALLLLLVGLLLAFRRSR